jgi:hypothetical protein
MIGTAAETKPSREPIFDLCEGVSRENVDEPKQGFARIADTVLRVARNKDRHTRPDLLFNAFQLSGFRSLQDIVDFRRDMAVETKPAAGLELGQGQR